MMLIKVERAIPNEALHRAIPCSRPPCCKVNDSKLSGVTVCKKLTYSSE